MKKKLIENFQTNYAEKIKDFKVWSNLHTPDLLKPALSYALDWLSPELLGTGFSVTEFTEEAIAATIPLHKANCDFHHQIHAGLVVNAGLEIASMFISKHWAKNLWEIQSHHLELNKKLRWDKDLTLRLSCSAQDIDMLLLSLQKNDQISFEETVYITKKNSSQADTLKIRLNIGKLKLLT